MGNLKRKSLILILVSDKGFKAIQMSRIINALYASNFEDFMVGFHANGADAGDKKVLEHIAEQMDPSQSVFVYPTGMGIIVSNKGCKINGHFTKHRTLS